MFQKFRRDSDLDFFLLHLDWNFCLDCLAWLCVFFFFLLFFSSSSSSSSSSSVLLFIVVDLLVTAPAALFVTALFLIVFAGHHLGSATLSEMILSVSYSSFELDVFAGFRGVIEGRMVLSSTACSTWRRR